MKINRTANNIHIIDSDDNVTHILPSTLVFKVSPYDDVEVLIGEKAQSGVDRTNFIRIDTSEVTEIAGVAFDGTRNEFMLAVDGIVNSFSLSSDYIDVEADGEYQSLINWGDRLDVLLIRTVTSGTSVTRSFYQQRVADLAAYNSLWADAIAGNLTFVNPISL